MSRLATYEVFIGESLPDLSLFYRENGQLVAGLNAGHTFELKIAPLGSNTALFTKTSGIVGQSGSGSPPLGTPNIVIQWADGDLASLPEGSFRALLKITRDADSRKRYVEWVIRARAPL